MRRVGCLRSDTILPPSNTTALLVYHDSARRFLEVRCTDSHSLDLETLTLIQIWNMLSVRHGEFGEKGIKHLSAQSQSLLRRGRLVMRLWHRWPLRALADRIVWSLTTPAKMTLPQPFLSTNASGEAE